MFFETFVVVWWWRIGVIAVLFIIPALIVHVRGQVAAIRGNKKTAQEMSRLVECSLAPWGAKTADERLFAYWHVASAMLWVFFFVLFVTHLVHLFV